MTTSRILGPLSHLAILDHAAMEKFAREKLSEERFHGLEPAMATDMAGVLLARPRTVDQSPVAEDHALHHGRIRQAQQNLNR